MSGWRYYLQAIPSGEWIDKDLALAGVEVTTACSSPAVISGYLPVEFAQLRNPDGSLAIREWGCLLVAEQPGRDPVVGIVDVAKTEGSRFRLEAGGFAAYPARMPWTGPDFAGIKVDPLDMVRKIWDHLQSYPDGDLGVTVDPTTSPVRIGEPERDVSFQTAGGDAVEFQTGPFRLASWTTEDLGKVIDDLAARTPFQYMERSYWDGETLRHRLQLGFPTIGARKPDLQFEVGINVIAAPPLEETDYASEVLLFGAGEGRTKISSGRIAKRTGRMRRVHVETDKAHTSKNSAQAAARAILESLTGGYALEDLEVVNHDSAPFGTFGPGDVIRVTGDAGWLDLDMWVLIDEMTIKTNTGRASLKVRPV